MLLLLIGLLLLLLLLALLLLLFDFVTCWLSGEGSVIGGGGDGTGTGVGTGPFFGESQLLISMLCRPGTIGGGGMPGPFFFNVDELELVRICGLAGCDAIEAHVIFLGTLAVVAAAIKLSKKKQKTKIILSRA